MNEGQLLESYIRGADYKLFWDTLSAMPEEEAKRQINQHNGTETALTHVCRIRDVDQLRLLLKHGADPNLFDGRKERPLQVAAKWNFTQGILELLAAGAEPRTRIDHDGNTLLHWYCSFKHSASSKTLYFLITKTSLVEWINDRKQGASDTPLETAITWHNKECAKILLDAGVKYPRTEPAYRLIPEWWKRMRVYFTRFKRNARIVCGILRFRRPHGFYKDICTLLNGALWDARWSQYNE